MHGREHLPVWLQQNLPWLHHRRARECLKKPGKGTWTRRLQPCRRGMCSKTAWLQHRNRHRRPKRLLGLLAQRFGPVPATLRRRIEAIKTLDPLERIAGQILAARSLAEIKLD